MELIDHSNYTFEQAGYNTAGRGNVIQMSTLPHSHSCHTNPRTQLPHMATIILNHPILGMVNYTKTAWRQG
jgi:hypothetical protein